MRREENNQIMKSGEAARNQDGRRWIEFPADVEGN